MARTTSDPHAGTTGADWNPPVFETYLEAHYEVARRKDQDAAIGVMSRVERSPYGGYVVRSWPMELLADPDMQSVTGNEVTGYQDR